MSLGRETKLPTFNACNFASSKVSPIPTSKVPFSTVMFSSVGCQWAGTFAPSAHRRRKTKDAPFAFRSPSTVARSHPLMSGVHSKFSKFTILLRRLPTDASPFFDQYLARQPQRVPNRLEHLPPMVHSQNPLAVENRWRFHGCSLSAHSY